MHQMTNTALFTDHHSPIIVKFMSRNIKRDTNIDVFMRQFPGKIPEWGKCRFDFNVDANEYDWLVVYHDLPKKPWDISKERLRCPRENTLLITTEPSTITVYGRDYLRQFGHILTSQEPWAIDHPGAVYTQPGLIWFYGLFTKDGIPAMDSNMITYDTMKAATLPEKKRLISTICSIRGGRLTLHHKRVNFTKKLKDIFDDLDVFGHGVNPIADKSEVLDPYQYHLTIENHVCRHHLTEKLPDAFLGFTVPFYHGCPNAADYYPAESFIPIDIDNFERSLDIIKNTIANNEYNDRLPYVIEARNRVLEKYNLFSILNREVTRHHKPGIRVEQDVWIMNRQTMRTLRPMAGLRSLCEKVLVRSKQKFKMV